MELELRSVKRQGAHEAGGCTQGVGRAPHPRGQVDTVWLILAPVFLYIPKIFSVYFQVNPRTLISAQK